MRRALAIVVAAAGLVLPACSTARAVTQGTVAVAEREFRVTPAVTSTRARHLRIVVRNGGTETHELAILRTGKAAARLPRIGALARTGAPGIEAVGEIENVAPGTARDRAFFLLPGRYVLICNLPGHYAAGMHAAFVVR